MWARLRGPTISIGLTLSYDAADNRIAVQDSLSGITTRTFDALNRATTMQFGGPGQTPLREDFAYSARDQVTMQTRFSNLAGTSTVGYSSMGYDPVGRLTNLQHLNSAGANIANYSNSFDLASRITAEVLNSAAPTTYTYDATNQLTNDTAVTYSYDLNGNRTMTGYSTGPANHLLGDGTSSYQYDRNGNQTQKINIVSGTIVTYAYDNRNRMTSAVDTINGLLATYSYDVVGQRVQAGVTLGGVTTVTRFTSDVNRQVWADLNGSNALQQRYLRGEYILELPARINAGGTASWLLTDRMGSVRNVLDNTGAVIDTMTYDAYGNVRSESNPANGGVYKFVGYRFDAETGLFRPDTSARYYDPASGRWKTTDPITFGAGDANPWRYVGNDPMNAVDPSGLAPTRDDFGEEEKKRHAEYDRIRTDPNTYEGAIGSLSDQVQNSDKYDQKTKDLIKRWIRIMILESAFDWYNEPLGPTGKCPEYSDKYQGKLTNKIEQMRYEAVSDLIAVDVVTWKARWPFYELTEAGHVAVRITIKDLCHFYVDDSYYGKDDHVFVDSEIDRRRNSYPEPHYCPKPFTPEEKTQYLERQKKAAR
jgi:RHS repeat-associated protein